MSKGTRKKPAAKAVTPPKPDPVPDLADLLARAHNLAHDYDLWEQYQGGNPDRFYSLKEMIVPGVLVVVGSSEFELFGTAMNALKAAVSAKPTTRKAVGS